MYTYLNEKQNKKIYYGWWISIAGGLNTAILAFPRLQVGVLFKAIEEEFNWSRAIVSV